MSPNSLTPEGKLPLWIRIMAWELYRITQMTRYGIGTHNDCNTLVQRDPQTGCPIFTFNRTTQIATHCVNIDPDGNYNSESKCQRTYKQRENVCWLDTWGGTRGPLLQFQKGNKLSKRGSNKRVRRIWHKQRPGPRLWPKMRSVQPHHLDRIEMGLQDLDKLVEIVDAQCCVDTVQTFYLLNENGAGGPGNEQLLELLECYRVVRVATWRF